MVVIDDAGALAIQMVGEFGEGLKILDGELKHGQFTQARDTIKELWRVVEMLDIVLPLAVVPVVR